MLYIDTYNPDPTEPGCPSNYGVRPGHQEPEQLPGDSNTHPNLSTNATDLNLNVLKRYLGSHQTLYLSTSDQWLEVCAFLTSLSPCPQRLYIPVNVVSS